MPLGAIAGGVLGAASGGAVGRAVVEVVGDSSKLQADLAKAKVQTATATNQMGAQTKKFSALSTGAFVAIGAVAVAGVGVAVKAAASLGEQMNRTRAIFEGSADSVIKFAEQAHASAGLSTRAALEGAASIGALLDSAGLAEAAGAKMSITMTQLAGDMASFSDASPEDMLIRLRAGLSGEAEPLRKFGVFIDEARVKTEAYASGLAKTGEELTIQQKIQARFNIIMKDTAKQQGDFAKTLGDSLPNQLRNFQGQMENVAATLGKAVLPVFTGLVTVLNLLAPILPTIVAAAVSLGAAFLAFKALGFLPALLNSIALGFAKLNIGIAANAVSSFSASLASLLPALGPVAIGIGALILAGEGLQGFVNNITNTVSTEQALATATAQLQTAVASGKFTWQEIRGAVDEYNNTIGSLPGAEKLSMDAIRGTVGAAEDLAGAYEEGASAAEDLLSAQLALAGGIVGIAASIDSAADSERELAEARAEVARLTREGKTGTEEYTAAVEAMDDAGRNSLQSQLNLAGAVEKFAEEAAATGDVQGAIDRVRDFGVKAGLTKGEINKMVGQVKDAITAIGNMPGAKSIDFSTPGLSGMVNDVQRLKDKLNAIPSSVTTRFVIIGDEVNPRPGGQVAAGGILAGAAGFITRGPTMLVGESRKMTFAGKGAEAVIPFDNRGIGILAKALEMAAGKSGGGAGGPIVQQYVNFDGAQFYGERDVRQMIRNALGELRQRGMAI